MRITNGMLTSNFLKNLNGNVDRMQKYQYQLSTGKKLQNLSEDPVGILKSMTARVKIARLNQHQKNVDSARTFLTQTETNLMELNKLLQSAYETAVQLNNDTYSENDRAATAAYIKELRDHVLDLGNGQESELYIFGGYATTQRPFEIINGTIHYKEQDMNSIPANDPERDQVIQYEIGHGIYSDVSLTGIEFMGEGDKNIYTVLDDFYNVLNDPSRRPDISGFIGKIIGTESGPGLQDRVLSQIADIGGRINRLDMVENRYATDKLTYTDMMSKVEDVDIAEATMQFMMAEAVYNSALNTGARILQPSLLDYIR